MVLFIHYVILTACLSSFCHCQAVEDLKVQLLEDAIGRIEALSQKLLGLEDGLYNIQVSQTSLEEKIQALRNDLEPIKGLAMPNESLHECSTREQLTNLQELLTTEVDECLTQTHNCNKNALCTNTIGSYKCTCRVGYVGDGFTCGDIDECRRGDHRCHSSASCQNLEGSYSCSCLSGYSGDGFSCTENVCESPSHYLEGLGCITPVREKMNWEAAKQNCLKKGSRLIEGITSQGQLNQLGRYFNPYFLPYGSDYSWEGHVWVGTYQWKWVSGDSVNPSSLWRSDEPDRGSHICGFVDLTATNPPLGDYECYKQWFSLCQK